MEVLLIYVLAAPAAAPALVGATAVICLVGKGVLDALNWLVDGA